MLIQTVFCDEMYFSLFQPTEGMCPVCQKEYPTGELELHASVCGDWENNLERYCYEFSSLGVNKDKSWQTN